MTTRGTARTRLLGFRRRRDIERVEIAAVLDAQTCLACLKHDGRVLTLDQALLEQPLPCRGCTCPMLNDPRQFPARTKCRCRYVALTSSPGVAERRADAKVNQYRGAVKAELMTARLRSLSRTPSDDEAP